VLRRHGGGEREGELNADSTSFSMPRLRSWGHGNLKRGTPDEAWEEPTFPI
jgi:hypothetical protein